MRKGGNCQFQSLFGGQFLSNFRLKGSGSLTPLNPIEELMIKVESPAMKKHKKISHV